MYYFEKSIEIPKDRKVTSLLWFNYSMHFTDYQLVTYFLILYICILFFGNIMENKVT